MREVLVGSIEEYARHMGHVDLLRERIDGRLGQSGHHAQLTTPGHHLAGYTKSAAGRPSHCTIRMATSMPVANFAVRSPVS